MIDFKHHGMCAAKTYLSVWLICLIFLPNIAGFLEEAEIFPLAIARFHSSGRWEVRNRNDEEILRNYATVTMISNRWPDICFFWERTKVLLLSLTWQWYQFSGSRTSHSDRALHFLSSAILSLFEHGMNFRAQYARRELWVVEQLGIQACLEGRERINPWFPTWDKLWHSCGKVP